MPESQVVREALRVYGEQMNRLSKEESDRLVAACAVVWDAAAWTLDPDDFAGIPGLRLHQP